MIRVSNPPIVRAQRRRDMIFIPECRADARCRVFGVPFK
jgi:hypothetical protein